MGGTRTRTKIEETQYGVCRKWPAGHSEGVHHNVLRVLARLMRCIQQLQRIQRIHRHPQTATNSHGECVQKRFNHRPVAREREISKDMGSVFCLLCIHLDSHQHALSTHEHALSTHEHALSTHTYRRMYICIHNFPPIFVISIFLIELFHQSNCTHTLVLPKFARGPESNNFNCTFLKQPPLPY